MIETDLEKKVRFKLNKAIEDNDFDVVILFLENHKQSGGGDIVKSHYDRLNNILSVTYEDKEVKNRIITKKFLKFKSYELNVILQQVEYKNEMYPIEKSTIILKNIEKNEDKLIVQMYAENLSPDNDVIELKESVMFDNTFYIKFKHDLDLKNLQLRHARKTKLRSKKIDLFNAFQTNLFLIKFEEFESYLIKENLNEKINKNFKKKFIYLDEDLSSKNILCSLVDTSIEENGQMNYVDYSTNDFDDFKNFINLNKVKIEYCYNFDFIKTKENQQISDSNKPNQKGRKKNKSTKKEKIVFPYVEECLILIETETKKDSNTNSFIKEEVCKQFVLNDQEPFIIGLLNIHQLFHDFNKILNKKNLECVILKKEASSNLLIKQIVTTEEKNEDLRNKIFENIDELNSVFSYKIFYLPNKIKNDLAKYDSFKHYLVDCNTRYTACHLNLINECVHAFGLTKPLNKVINHINKFIKDLFPQSEKENPNGIEIYVGDESTQTIKKEKKIQGLINKNLIIEDLIYGTVFDHSFIPEETVESLTSNLIQIDESKYPLLYKSCLNCPQIMFDLNKELKQITNQYELIKIITTNESSKSNRSETFCIKLNKKMQNFDQIKTKIFDLLNQYEKIKLRFETIKTNDCYLKSEENLKSLLSKITIEKELDTLKEIFELFHGSHQVVAVKLNSNRFFEIFGYERAVQTFSDHIHKAKEKNLNKLFSQLQGKLEYKLKISKEPKLIAFYKFDELYFIDLNKRLASIDAIAIKMDDEETIQVGCLNKTLIKDSRKIYINEEVDKWRSKSDGLIQDYLSNFTFESLNMPFKKDDKEAQYFLYDKNSIDIVWKSQSLIEMFGIKQEINLLKNKLKK